LTRRAEFIESRATCGDREFFNGFSGNQPSEVYHDQLTATNGRGPRHAVNVLFLRTEQQMNESPTNYTLERRTGFAVPSTTARLDNPRHNLNAPLGSPGTGVFSWPCLPRRIKLRLVYADRHSGDGAFLCETAGTRQGGKLAVRSNRVRPERSALTATAIRYTAGGPTHASSLSNVAPVDIRQYARRERGRRGVPVFHTCPVPPEGLSTAWSTAERLRVGWVFISHVRKLLSALWSRAGGAGLSTARRRWSVCTALAVGFFHPTPNERTAGESCPVDGVTPSGCLGGGVNLSGG
jgi:hypothetical protein